MPWITQIQNIKEADRETGSKNTSLSKEKKWIKKGQVTFLSSAPDTEFPHENKLQGFS
jgi:hypothetical protein